jgi:hypothetical protein
MATVRRGKRRRSRHFAGCAAAIRLITQMGKDRPRQFAG